MPLPKLVITKLSHPWLPWLIAGLIGLSLMIIGSWSRSNHYDNRLLPNTTIGQVDVSGLTKEQAGQLLSTHWNKLAQQGWVFRVATTTVTVYPIANLGEGAPLIAFDQEASLNSAWQNNQAGHGWQKIIKLYQAWLFGYHTKAAITINEKLLTNELTNNFQPLIIPGQPAKITVKTDGTYLIEPEKTGQKIEYAAAIKQLGQQLIRLQQQPITLSIITDQPSIQQSAANNLTPIIDTYLKLAPLKLTASTSKQAWSIDRAAIASWLNLELANKTITVGPATSSIVDYLTKHQADEINLAPQAGQFKKVGNRLEQFQPGRDGRQLNLEASALAIRQALLTGTSTIQLTVEEIKNPLNDNDPASLGIIELLGTGSSSFTGSPANRIHNIKTGTNQVSGRLIAPDEEFSLVKTLGDISAETGYKPELVIKQGKTLPEYGGGLCQVATTIFRTALVSGLPITQRQNHSYRVSYYEPAGTDAAVYDPWPDLRFINDTGHHILMLGEINGKNLSFSFWGTKDGRAAEQTKPTIYNIVKPPEKQLIETDSLEPGQIKCTEKAHNGADAYFNYTVTYPSGEVKDRRFKSHYVPWQEICLVGKGGNTNTASSTPTTTATTIAPIQPTSSAPIIKASSTNPVATTTATSTR